MSLVSIIIPAYNASRFVGGAIDSALSQTYVDREVIVVNDGSTDGTVDILNRFGNSIRVIEQENMGTAAASNTAVGAARGKWIAFLDADDEWLPHKLETQLGLCSRFAISHTDNVCFSDTSTEEITRSAMTQLHEGMLLPQLLVSNFITKSSVVVLRDVFLESGGFPKELDAVEDWPLWQRICAKHALGYVPQALVKYRVHQQSKSMKARQTFAAHIRIINEAFGAGGVGELHQELRPRALATSLRVNCHYAAETGDWAFAIGCALRALRFEPSSLQLWKTLVKCAAIPFGVKY